MKESFFDENPENLIKNPELTDFKAETTELLNYAPEGQLTELQDIEVEITNFELAIKNLKSEKNQLYKELLELDFNRDGGDFTQENFEIEASKIEKRKEIKIKDGTIEELQKEIKKRKEQKNLLVEAN